METGTKTNLGGALKPSAIEFDGYEGAMFAHRYMLIESNQQMRVEYNADNTTKYRGFAPRGLAEGTTGWLIQYLEYTDRKVVKRTIAYDSWGNRATATYS